MMEGKKISFGFTKTKKIDKPVVVEKKDFIECLEEKSIKVIGGEVVEDTAPLVIPMKPNTLMTAERLQQIAEEVEKGAQEPLLDAEKEDKSADDGPLIENETLDQMAERELLNEAKKERKEDRPALTVAVPSLPVLDGQKESTLEDYDSVPVQEFGMAMLRGMGWSASKEQQFKHKQPELRPKGLGLGADKVVKENQKKNVSKNKDEELSIVKNSYVKITTGKYSGSYGKVVSLDEDNGRVMVDIAIKKETVSLSEFMMQAVTKSEFDKQSKVINAASYEEYKKSEQKGSNTQKVDREASSSQRANESKTRRNDEHKSRRDYEKSSNGRNNVQERRHRSRSSSDDTSRHRKKSKKRYSSADSLSSLSESEKRSTKHRTERKRYSSEESDSSDDKYKKDKRKKDIPDKKRDIDKKRKGKKKKRDRDRSPTHKKHRK